MKYFFLAEIHEREVIRTILSKYIAVFDYFDKTLLVLSATSGGVSIVSFAMVIGAPIGITSASSDLVFSISNGIAKNLLK